MDYIVFLLFISLAIAMQDDVILRTSTTSVNRNDPTNFSCVIGEGDAHWQYGKNGNYQVVADGQTVHDPSIYTAIISKNVTASNATRREYTLVIKHAHISMDGADFCCFSELGAVCSKLHVKPVKESAKNRATDRNLTVYFMIAFIPAVMLLFLVPLYIHNYLQWLKPFERIKGCLQHCMWHERCQTTSETHAHFLYSAKVNCDEANVVGAKMCYSPLTTRPFVDGEGYILLDGHTV